MFLEEMIPVPLEKLPCWNNPVKAEELAKVMVLANAPSRFWGRVQVAILRGSEFSGEGKRIMKALLPPNLFIPKRLAPTFR